MIAKQNLVWGLVLGSYIYLYMYEHIYIYMWIHTYSTYVSLYIYICTYTQNIFVHSEIYLFEQHTSVEQNKPAASLFSRKQGLGAPMHITIWFVLIAMYDCTLLLLWTSIMLIAYWLPIECLLIVMELHQHITIVIPTLSHCYCRELKAQMSHWVVPMHTSGRLWNTLNTSNPIPF